MLVCMYLLSLRGFSGGSAGKESSCNTGDLSSIPGLGRSPGEGKSYPLQYSGLENSMDSMDCTVHEVTKSRTWLSLSHGNSLFWTSLMAQGSPDGKSLCQQCRRPYLDPWVGKIPWRRKRQPTPVLLPGKSDGQRSLIGYSPWGHRVGHDWATSLSLFTCPFSYLFGCARC